MTLEGKTIFITGGSGLIGAAAVHRLLELKATVWNLSTGDPATNEEHPRLKQHPFDVTDTSEHDRFFETLLSDGIVIDAWINCAFPISEDWGTPFGKVPESSLQTNITGQMNSVFLLSQKVVAHMEALRTKGSIVNIASVHGMVAPHFPVYDGIEPPMTSPPAYAMIKGGIIQFTRYLAALLGPKGIRVNTVSPGGVERTSHDPNFVKNYSKQTPLGRMAQPEDVAGPIAFLCSDEAAYITGHNLVVDGGHSIW
jgi:NAD(P)-dependent dehydrogenase (short-subunit alcohol dehydrogenase family)